MSKRDHNLRPLAAGGVLPAAADSDPKSPLFAAKTRGIAFHIFNLFDKHRKWNVLYLIIAGLPGWLVAAAMLYIIAQNHGWF